MCATPAAAPTPTIRIHADDNVVIARRQLVGGENLRVQRRIFDVVLDQPEIGLAVMQPARDPGAVVEQQL